MWLWKGLHSSCLAEKEIRKLIGIATFQQLRAVLGTVELLNEFLITWVKTSVFDARNIAEKFLVKLWLRIVSPKGSCVQGLAPKGVNRGQWNIGGGGLVERTLWRGLWDYSLILVPFTSWLKGQAVCSAMIPVTNLNWDLQRGSQNKPLSLSVTYRRVWCGSSLSTNSAVERQRYKIR